MAIYSLDGCVPSIAATSQVAETASVVGRVTLAADTQVGPRAVLRADNELIAVGEASRLGAGVVLHTDPGYPLHIGVGVHIDREAMLHGCSVGDGSVIGARAVLLNGAVIGRHSVVAAGALVTEGKVFADHSLIAGAPAKAVDRLGDAELAALDEAGRAVAERAGRHAQGLAFASLTRTCEQGHRRLV